MTPEGRARLMTAAENLREAATDLSIAAQKADDRATEALVTEVRIRAEAVRIAWWEHWRERSPTPNGGTMNSMHADLYFIVPEDDLGTYGSIYGLREADAKQLVHEAWAAGNTSRLKVIRGTFVVPTIRGFEDEEG